MDSTNQTGPRWVIFRKRNRGEKHSTQTDAGARSRPNARALAASLDKTIPVQEPVRVRRMTGSHSELRYCRFQVPKNRKVFRRIFEASLQAKGNWPAGRPTSAANYGMISIKERTNVVDWPLSGSESAKGKPPISDQAPGTAKIK